LETRPVGAAPLEHRHAGEALQHLVALARQRARLGWLGDEHVLDKAAGAMHDRDVILLLIARKPT